MESTKRLALVSLLLSFWSSIALSQPIQAQQDKSLEVKEVKGDGTFVLWLMPAQISEATLMLQCDAENVRQSRKTPFTVDVSNKTFDLTKPQQLLIAQQDIGGRLWNFHWKYHWQKGIRGGKHNDAIVYRIPFEHGRTTRINQGYSGTFSHQKGTDSQYAIDFKADDGQQICAARSGVIVGIRQDSNIGGKDKSFADAANYVMIKHDDGTYGNYLHLRQNSVMVRLNQLVKAGDPLALVGTTGMTTVPHLHFDVSVPIDGLRRKTFPTKFRTSTKASESLTEGESYTVE